MISLASLSALLLILFLLPSQDGSGRSGRADAAAENGIAAQPQGVVNVVETLKPAIVSVISTHTGGLGMEGVGNATIGSGIIYEKTESISHIVTNHHVIDGAASIEVVLSDGLRLDATVIGSDALTDLAVLEIDSREVKGVAEFGDSNELKEGEAAIAIGHPFGLGYSPTFTLGIISSLSRVIPISLAMDGNVDWEMELLQTDAAINHGNSGGALVSMEGKVIGINSMKVAQPGVEGIGFAIPSNNAVPIIEELVQYGMIRRPYLGVATVDLKQYRNSGELEDVLKLPRGVEDGIIVLEAYGPAADVGIKTNDVIVALDGEKIDSTLALRKFLYTKKKIGDTIRAELYREGEKLSLEMRLSESPKE